MARTSLVTWLLLILLAMSSTLFADSNAAAADTTSSRDHKVLVYYLYFNPRCQTCINMEIYSKEAVETGFAELLKDGRVEWHTYDMDSTESAHFWNDFQLETKSLVMVDIEDGKQVRWKNCERIWDLEENKADFIKYVQDEVRAYLSNN